MAHGVFGATGKATKAGARPVDEDAVGREWIASSAGYRMHQCVSNVPGRRDALFGESTWSSHGEARAEDMRFATLCLCTDARLSPLLLKCN